MEIKKESAEYKSPQRKKQESLGVLLFKANNADDIQVYEAPYTGKGMPYEQWLRTFLKGLRKRR